MCRCIAPTCICPANVGAGSIYFWGQELTIHTLAAKRPEGCADNCERAKAVRHCVADIIRLPLLLPDDFDYPGMIAEIVRLRRERRPDTVKEEAAPAITLRPIADDDLEFLFHLYASTRAGEKELVGWRDEQWEVFMRMQFNLQHSQYMQNYEQPSFDVIMLGDTPVGRLYVNRGEDEIRIVDISLLPEYRGRGIGADLLRSILQEGDDKGVPVTPHVEWTNPALALYQRLDFQEEGFAEVYCFMKRLPGQSLSIH
ncbi:GNAT family N-acetyltransferase [Geotalea uraniireducens]|uniref:GCN5-related N-acetyltransferase n=1 Tax=Geotalea uraniireducens (strain Rf4) TaxID=351605 RepID=A5GBT8_GEOUR|nr:GNAT family N-acetyltransferase [Geotalea uraniireducens]ABQ24958.1 GCN5-related N-acetyltransferase [Geotalea uraniireducens Rf4]